VPCPQCGRATAEGDRFCGGCGTELVVACRGCGRPLTPGLRFCTGCGRRADEPAQAGTQTEDRRRISVLFVDLVDFTPYAERADPELVRTMQTGFYATARRVVDQYGGVVEKFIGDAVMALFGAPVATETDALRCVRAGLELQRVLAKPGLRFRVGVATGEALVDVAAARHGGQAIVAGDVVNTASRLQAVAPPGGVLVCGHTRALTGDAIRYAARPPVTLRGRSTPTEVWLALSPVQRQQAEPDADATPLVDREHELGLLVNALHRAVRDRVPALVTVFGRAGIGKSRLVRELVRHGERILDEPVRWRTGHCPPFGENVTYAGLADIVKAEAGILDTDAAETARERLERAVRALLPHLDRGPAEADRLVAALGPLVGLPGPAVPAEEAETAWRRFLVALAADRPTVLVFEDLHWADDLMLRFIELLAAAARDVPLVVLGTARPELVDRDASWAGTITGSLTITLPPLRSSAIATLYGHMFGRAAFAADQLNPLVELADGNPLYAQEYVRMLLERGAVRQSGAGWRMDGGADLPMPDSVQSVIANRVDLLDPTDRAVLQAAAVVGMQFWPGAVAGALGRPVESVERALRHLQQRDFVTEQLSAAGHSEFRFRHVLVRDVCYQRLPRSERVARHERTAAWLDELSRRREQGTAPAGGALVPEAHSDLVEVIAHHRWVAHEVARSLGLAPVRYATAAGQALHRAARRAYSLGALDAAAIHVGRALALFESVADEADHRRERLRLELFATEIAFYRDRAGFLAGGGTDQLRTLAELLASTGADADAARAYTLLGQAAWLRADRAVALAHVSRAVQLFGPLPDSAEKADAYAELGRLHMLCYERDPAVAAAGIAAEIAQRLGLVEAQASARITVATARYYAGDPSGLDELVEVTGFCRARQLLALRRATQNLAAVLLEEGDWQRSVTVVAEGHRPDVQGGHTLHTGYSGEALRAYYTGDFDALAAAADAFADTPGGQWDMQIRGLRAVLRVLRDEATGPRDDLTEALATVRGGGFQRPLWTALAMAALCRAMQDRPGEAAELIGELVDSWRKVPVIASGEWVGAAAFAAALAGPDAARTLRAPVAEQEHHHRWSEAALHTLHGAVAGADGDPAGAARHHLAAAEIYAGIPAVTDRMLALVLAAAALRAAGDADAAESALGQVRGFADRNRAPGLLRLTGTP
jgi:class 3 adenylate cyclase